MGGCRVLQGGRMPCRGDPWAWGKNSLNFTMGERREAVLPLP